MKTMPFRPFADPVSAVHTARRCARLLYAADREAAWLLQWQSWQIGGIPAFADSLLARFPSEFVDKEPVGAVEYLDFPRPVHRSFKPVQPGSVPAKVYLDLPRFLWAAANGAEGIGATYPGSPLEFSATEQAIAEAGKLAGPDWCPTLFDLVRQAMQKRAEEVKARLAQTTVSTAVCRGIAMCCRTRTSALIWGSHRIGKRFAAANYVARFPGRARLVECPSYQDEKDFLLAVARAIGIPAGLDDRAAAMREAVKAALAGPQSVAIVLDEASRLWPSRGACPHRLLFIMELMKAGLPVVFLTLRDWFSGRERTAAGGWKVEELDGRIQHQVKLPEALDKADVAALVNMWFPTIDQKFAAEVSATARQTPIPLRWIESVSSKAAYLAELRGQSAPSQADIERAIKACNGEEMASAVAAELAQGKRPAAILPKHCRVTAGVPPAVNEPPLEGRQNQPRQSARSLPEAGRLAPDGDLLTVET